MHDANAAAAPTAQDIDTISLAHLDVRDAILPDEHHSMSVHIHEFVRYEADGTPVYRRVRITDAMAHPGAIRSLVRDTLGDMDAETDRARHEGDEPSSHSIRRRAV